MSDMTEVDAVEPESLRQVTRFISENNFDASSFLEPAPDDDTDWNGFSNTAEGAAANAGEGVIFKVTVTAVGRGVERVTTFQSF